MVFETKQISLVYACKLLHALGKQGAEGNKGRGCFFVTQTAASVLSHF